MRDVRNERSRSELAIPAAVIFGLPAFVGGAWLLSGGTIPLQSMIVMFGVYLMAVSWLAMSIINGREARAASAKMHEPAARVTAESMRVMQSWPALELVPSLSARGTPMSIEVTGAVGICPRGFKAGDRITVGRDGALSRPICRTAVAALSPALDAGAESSNGFESQVSCLCPLAMRHLTFSIGMERVAFPN